jgi:hypothetical protein
MNKPETQAILRQDTEWTNQRHRQHWEKTQNGKTKNTSSIGTRHIMGKRVTSSIGIRHRMDKPETQAALKQDRE